MATVVAIITSIVAANAAQTLRAKKSPFRQASSKPNPRRTPKSPERHSASSGRP